MTTATSWSRIPRSARSGCSAASASRCIYIKTCAKEMTTNVAFGGPDNKTLYITESRSGSILTARLPVAGKRMYLPFLT